MFTSTLSTLRSIAHWFIIINLIFLGLGFLQSLADLVHTPDVAVHSVVYIIVFHVVVFVPFYGLHMLLRTKPTTTTV